MNAGVVPIVPRPARGTVLGFDFGTRRIGIALGEYELGTAHPLETIDAEDNQTRFGRIADLLTEWRPVALVVGLPLAMSGEAHAMTARATRFANQLHGRFNLPVFYADERLTSVEAGAKLHEAGGSSRDKAALDALAAQRILLDHFARSKPLDRPVASDGAKPVPEAANEST